MVACTNQKAVGEDQFSVRNKTGEHSLEIESSIEYSGLLYAGDFFVNLLLCQKGRMGAGDHIRQSLLRTTAQGTNWGKVCGKG